MDRWMVGSGGCGEGRVQGGGVGLDLQQDADIPGVPVGSSCGIGSLIPHDKDCVTGLQLRRGAVEVDARVMDGRRPGDALQDGKRIPV